MVLYCIPLRQRQDREFPSSLVHFALSLTDKAHVPLIQVIFTDLIMKLPPLYDPKTGSIAHKVLILVGSVELARQAALTIKRTWPKLVRPSSPSILSSPLLYANLSITPNCAERRNRTRFPNRHRARLGNNSNVPNALPFLLLPTRQVPPSRVQSPLPRRSAPRRLSFAPPYPIPLPFLRLEESRTRDGVSSSSF